MNQQVQNQPQAAAKPAEPTPLFAVGECPPATATKVKGNVMVRAPFHVGRFMLRSSACVGQDGVDDVRIDYASQTVWAHRNTTVKESWGWTPFSNVIGCDFGERERAKP